MTSAESDPIAARGPKALLDDYAAIARRRGPAAIEATALRMRSIAIRDIVAHLASDARWTYSELLAALDRGDRSLKPRWTAALGRIVGFQNLLAEDRKSAIALLEASVHSLPAKSRTNYAKTQAELLFAEGRRREYHDLLEQYTDLREIENGYLWTDLLNPFVVSPYRDAEAWYDGFARLFTESGLPAPTLTGNSPTAFDRLAASTPAQADGPLVTVIFTTYRPSLESLVTSVTSILNQSWRNLELIIVDDASPDEYAPTLNAVEHLDERIKMLRLRTNGGTYIARNAALEIASGEYITGQDDDDWSHPQRLARQLDPLLTSDEYVATRSRSVTVHEDLVIQRPGYPPTRPNASSLTFPRELALRLGGFLPSRRGADSEFHSRLVAASGKPVLTINEPLALVRIRIESLSRSDFQVGWHHPARRSLRGAFQRWHEISSPTDLSVRKNDSPIPIPDRFLIGPRPADPVDVLLIGDWRQYGGPQKSMIEEIKALTHAGLHVGILHVEAARFLGRRDLHLCAPIQDLINDRVVRRVANDQVLDVGLAVLRYPPILQFPPAEALSIRVKRLLILANQAPSERDGSDIRYSVTACSENAEALFGLRAVWVPQGPTVRDAIRHEVVPEELADFDMPGILNVDEWQTERVSFRSNRPVVGRHSRDNAMKWPEDRAALESVYPVDGRVDVRLMGGHRSVLAVLGSESIPPAWVSFPADELDVRTFLNSIDFFVYFQHTHAYDAFGRATLEALATGCVGILPPHLQTTFGEAAVYAEPRDAMNVVERLYRDPEAYMAQSERALAHIRRTFSHDAYVREVERILASDTLRAGRPSI